MYSWWRILGGVLLAVSWLCFYFVGAAAGWNDGWSAGFSNAADSRLLPPTPQCGRNEPAYVECKPSQLIAADRRPLVSCRFAGEGWPEWGGVVDFSEPSFLLLMEWDPLEQNWDRVRYPVLP